MIERDSVRLIVLDAQNRILLMHYLSKGFVSKNTEYKKSFWITPGGKLEHGETFKEAALRELKEETGICKAEFITPAVWYSEYPLEMKGKKRLMKESFFLVRAGLTTLSTEGFEKEEQEDVIELKWWTLEEIKNSQEMFFPKNFAKLLEDLFLNLSKEIKTIHLVN